VITYVNFSGLSGTSAQISNVTEIIVGAGEVINFTMYVTDTSNNVKQNSTLITVADRTLPVVNTTFNTTTPYVYDIINFTGNITDETGLSTANITINFSTGTEYVNFTGLSGTSTQISNATDLTGKVVVGDVLNFTMYVTDTNNNVKQNSTLLTVALRCRDLDRPNFNYNLTQDVVSDGTCFTIKANDITLDCKGFEINYSITDIGYGINISSQNFTTIKSCDIVQADLSPDNILSHGIYTISNSSNITIYNNSLTAYGTDSSGIYMYGYIFNSNIYNNSITTNGNWSFDGSDGITMQDNIFNNSIYNNSITTSGTSAYSIIGNSSIYQNLIFGNTLETNGQYS